MRTKTTAAEWAKLYNQFMRSEAWQRKRGAVLVRANHLCECCLEQRATEVHHVVYPQSRTGSLTITDFEQQPNWQLRAICSSCHRQQTEARR